MSSRKATALAHVRVLLVEDDQDSLEMMQAALQHAGAIVTAATSAQKAFEALGQGPTDVIVSDLKMPGEDGLSFARALQTVPSLGSIPILAVTGFDELYVKRELHAAGFIGILRKPITSQDLIRAVAALCRGSDAKR